MLKILRPIHSIDAIACSGGPDSMAALNFVQQTNPEVKAVYFHHGTEHGEEAFNFLVDYCSKRNIELLYSRASNQPKPRQDSQEEHWRNQRYAFFRSLDLTIATCHHLDDVAETWLFSNIHGQAKTIPYRNQNIVRPFLLTPKADLVSWCERKSVPYLKDPSNNDLRFMRNRIRHNLMPEVLQINPGFLKVVARQVKLNEGFQGKLALHSESTSNTGT